jgi:hypothetical protein
MHAVMRPRDSSITPASGSPLPPPVPLLPVPDRPRPVSDRCGRARFRSHELGVGQRRRPGQSRHVTADRLLEKCIAVLEDDREHIDHPYQSNTNPIGARRGLWPARPGFFAQPASWSARASRSWLAKGRRGRCHWTGSGRCVVKPPVVVSAWGWDRAGRGRARERWAARPEVVVGVPVHQASWTACGHRRRPVGWSGR